MFRNYVLSSLRYIRKNKLFSFINVLGLSLGLMTFLLIILYVVDDYSYDRFFRNSDRIYRMVLERIYPDNSISYAIIPHSFQDVLKSDFPEVEDALRLWKAGGELVFRYKDIRFPEQDVMFADSNFFRFFSLPLVEGDPETVLNQPNGIVLTESTARRYFGDEDPVGKMLQAPFGEFMVSGVCADVPSHSHIRFNILAPLHLIPLFRTKNYISFSVYQYILLREGYDPAGLEKKFPEMVRKYAAGQIQANMGLSFDDYVKAGNGYRYYLQPLKSIHLHSRLNSEIQPNGNALYTALFILVAFFVLGIAVINFMNLSTARSNERSRETGIRKVIGATRIQLSRQFLMESLMIGLLSLAIALVFVELLLPSFNQFTGKSLLLPYLSRWYLVPLLLSFGILIGLLAGIYPAMILSRFRAADVIKGQFSSSEKGRLLRNILVVVQFSISIILISATLLTGRQIRYLTHKDLGYRNTDILFVKRAYSLGDQLEAFRQEVNKLPGVEASAYASTTIAGGYYPGLMFQTRRMSSDVLTTRGMFVEDEFFDVMGFDLLEGRTFGEAFNDSLALVINETTVKEFGLSQPVGSKLYNYNEQDSTNREYEVVGVVKDFHFTSLHHPIVSFMFFSDEGAFMNHDRLYIHYDPGVRKELLSQLEDLWNRISPEEPFSYSFLEDELHGLYENESRSERLFVAFAILAVVIACIGLFGLASFLAEKKTREIGIRKVLGSNVWQIVSLLGWNFGKLIGISFLISAPLSYLWMKSWLQNFAYRIDVPVMLILLSGLVAMLIALLTVSYQSVRAALTNPAEALRSE